MAIELSIIDITAATISGMILGFFWYSDSLFAKTWMQCLSKTPDALGSTTLPMIGAICASLMTATGIALLHALIVVTTLSTAIGIGLVLGLLILFPAMLSDNLFCGWGAKLLLIQSGYRALTVLLMSVVIYLF